MQAALGLARRGLGTVWPNPAVGCVLVRPDGEGGRVVARGWTQTGGRPHGETEAMRRAGEAADGATAYVSLEPCNHWGVTPPCADAMVAAGIARAVIALEDPDPRVSGRGVARLRGGGVGVEMGLCAEEAAELNAGFFLRIHQGRPLVTLKLATTLDGRIATHGGRSQWITGEPAREHAHGLRARHDAVMVGIGTALADDPRLTCRLPGMADRSPVRVVVDGRMRLPLTAKVVATAAEVPTWLFTRAEGDPSRREAYEDAGVEVITLPVDRDDPAPMAAIMQLLGGRGITRVLVEGGSHLAAALLRDDLADRLVWFRASTLMGGDGIPAAQPFGVDALADMARFERVAVAALGEDMMETYRRRR